VTRPARWALSPVDYAAHLLPDGDQPIGVLKARCGYLLPPVVTEPPNPTGRKCPRCEAIFLADLDAPGRFSRQEVDLGQPLGRACLPHRSRRLVGLQLQTWSTPR
jgi:hypothetical protein